MSQSPQHAVARPDAAGRDERPSYGRRLSDLAAEKGDGPALVFAASDGTDLVLSWADLEARANRLARHLGGRGLGVGGRLAVGLPNCPEHVIAAFAGWKLGATVVPLRWDLPEWERSRVRQVVDAAVTLTERADPAFTDTTRSDDPLPDVVAPRARGICSSGSTGLPKVIVAERPGLVDVDRVSVTATIVESYGAQPHPQLVLVPGPLYHTNGFGGLNHLLAGDAIALLERFDPSRALDVIETWSVDGFTAATILLQRIARVDGVEGRDLSSLRWVQQGAARLPEWLARRWIDLVGPERFFMSYGMSEGLGLCAIRGDEWLEHPGSVGRPFGATEIRVLAADGSLAPSGEVGEIFMRSPGGTDFSYLGDSPRPTSGGEGFYSVGDIGTIDGDGYVYIVDRRTDMIITGGANVFPAEVECALSEHPAVADVVVIGLADPEWGRRVHAIVVAADPARPPTAEEVVVYAKSRLAAYKVPKSVEFLSAMPRSAATKINRSALVDERER